MFSLFEAVDVNDYQAWPGPKWHCSSSSSNKPRAQIDSSCLCDPYRCALDIWGGEESCGQRIIEVTFLKIISVLLISKIFECSANADLFETQKLTGQRKYYKISLKLC